MYVSENLPAVLGKVKRTICTTCK